MKNSGGDRIALATRVMHNERMIRVNDEVVLHAPKPEIARQLCRRINIARRG